MSASEKLRQLIEEAAWEGGQGGGHDATRAIENVFPLIADVIEAAERAHLRYGGEAYEKAEALEEALTTLNRVLGEFIE